MIDDKVMDNLLELSRLSLGSEELAALRNQLQDIIEYFQVLESYDTEGVDVDMGNAVAADEIREDVRQEGMDRSALEQLSADFKDGFFVVPRILGDADNA